MVLKHYCSGVDFLKDLKESKHSTNNNNNKKNKFIKRKKSKSPIGSSKVTRKDGADWIRYLEQLLEQQQQQEESRRTLKSTGNTDLFNDSPLWSVLFGLNCSTLTSSSSSSKCFDRSNDIMWRFWKWNSSPFRSSSSRSSRSSLTSGALFDNRSNSIQDLLFSRSNTGEDGVIGKPLYFVDRFKNNLNQSMEHCYSTNQLKQLAILEYTDLYRYVTDDFDEYDSEQLEEFSSRRVSSSSIVPAGVSGSRRMSTTGNGRSTRTYFIFKDGVPPLWEDEYNAAGGCWSLILNRDQLRSSQFNSARQLWKLLIGLVIDDRMKIYLDEICGFGLSIKSNGTYKITVWNRDSDHTIVKMMIGQLLKSLINIASVSMSYYSHKTTICKAYRQGRPSQSNNVRNNSRLHHNQSDQYLSNNRRLRSFSRSPTTDSPLYSPNHRNTGCTYGTGSLEDIEHHYVGNNSPNSSFSHFGTNLNSRYPQQQQQQRSTSSTQNLFSSSNSHLSRFWDLNEDPQPQQSNNNNMGYSQFYKHLPSSYLNKSSSNNNNFFQQDSDDSTFTSTFFTQFPTRSNHFNNNLSNLNNRTNSFSFLQNNHNYSNIRNNNRNFYNNRY